MSFAVSVAFFFATLIRRFLKTYQILKRLVKILILLAIHETDI